MEKKLRQKWTLAKAVRLIVYKCFCNVLEFLVKRKALDEAAQIICNGVTFSL